MTIMLTIISETISVKNEMCKSTNNWCMCVKLCMNCNMWMQINKWIMKWVDEEIEEHDQK